MAAVTPLFITSRCVSAKVRQMIGRSKRDAGKKKGASTMETPF